MSFDLHTHSTRSDGVCDPDRVVELAAAAGLDGVALTDHDTIAGWLEAAQACRDAAIGFVPGIELSTESLGSSATARGSVSVHLLGYWVDAGHAELAATCARLRTERERRTARMVACLAELGAAVDLERVHAIAGDAPIGRPHVAAALVEAGHVTDHDEAFDRYLGQGRPAHVSKQALTPAEGVRLIRRAGGAAVLAHPGLCGQRGAADGAVPADMLALLDELTVAGLAGVEADHVGHGDATAAAWRALAQARDLVVTGASDFHGRHPDERLGSGQTPAAAVAELAARAGVSEGAELRGADLSTGGVG